MAPLKFRKRFRDELQFWNRNIGLVVKLIFQILLQVTCQMFIFPESWTYERTELATPWGNIESVLKSFGLIFEKLWEFKTMSFVFRQIQIFIVPQDLHVLEFYYRRIGLLRSKRPVTRGEARDTWKPCLNRAQRHWCAKFNSIPKARTKPSPGMFCPAYASF